MDYYLTGDKREQQPPKFLTPSQSSTRRQTLDSQKKEVSRNSTTLGKNRTLNSEYYRTNQSTQLSDRLNQSHFQNTLRTINSSRKSNQESCKMSKIMDDIIDCLTKLMYIKGEFILEKMQIVIKKSLLAKLFIDCGLVRKHDVSILDIQMSKEFGSKPSVGEEDLEKVIVLVARNFYVQNFKENPKSTIKEMFTQFLQPYVNNLLIENTSPLSKLLINWNNEEIISESLIQKKEELKQLLQFYKKQAFSIQEKDSQLLLFKFGILKMMRDFEVCPFIIQMKDLFILYQLLTKNKTSFELNEFLLLLQGISQYYFHELFSNEQQDLNFKIDILLKRIEISKGYELYRKSMMATTYKNPPSFFISSINSRRQSLQEQSRNSLKNLKANEHEYQDLSQIDQNILKAIFQHYSSFGEPLNHSHLKSIKLVKMFKDISLLNKQQYGISLKDLDLIIVKIVGSSKSINFNQFLIILELCAQKIWNKQSQPFQYLIENQLKPQAQSIQQLHLQHVSLDLQNINSFLEQLNKETVAKIQNLMTYCLESYFRVFSHQKKGQFMVFNDFYNFCSQFEIFPDMLSITSLNLLFNTLCNKKDQLDLPGFIQSLCLIVIQSFQQFYNNYTIEQKILLLVEKLSILQPQVDKKLRQTFKNNTDLQIDHKHKDIMRVFLQLFIAYFPKQEKESDMQNMSLRDIMNDCESNNGQQL